MLKSKKQPAEKNKIETKAPAAEPAGREVGFVLSGNGAGQVCSCGDFNDWHPTSLRMINSPHAGLWEKRLVLPPGCHEYKFVVDAQWRHDPDTGENVPNNYVSLNSVVEVRP